MKSSNLFKLTNLLESCSARTLLFPFSSEPLNVTNCKYAWRSWIGATALKVLHLLRFLQNACSSSRCSFDLYGTTNSDRIDFAGSSCVFFFSHLIHFVFSFDFQSSVKRNIDYNFYVRIIFV